MDINAKLIYSSLVLFSIIFFIQKVLTSLLKPKKKLPPSPPSLPILGHLHLYKPPLHHTFWALAQKHGPIFSLRLGTHRAIVVSSPSTVEECLAKNDVVFADRPKLLSGLHLAYNNTVLTWAPYGAHWRNLRLVTTILAFSTKQIERAGPTRRAEIRAMVQELIRSSKGTSTPTKVDLSSIFGRLTRNLVMRMLNGKPWEYPVIIAPSHTVTTICDFVPVLRWVGYKGIQRSMIKFNRERDEFLQKLIDEVRKYRAIRATDSVQGHQEGRKYLVEELLDLQEDEPDYYTDYILKGIILALIVAGSETSARTLEHTMLLLMNHPKVLKKARIEIDTHVGEDRLVDDSDLPKLTYIRWIINESLRLYPPAPLLLPHCSSQDCIVGGYYVPKRTMLFVNAWALHRDPTLWEEPNRFKPERFENDKDQGSSKYLPFGLGRRSCPGNNLALRNISLAIANLIQCFDWEKDECDLIKEGPIVLPKDKPLLATCHLRSSIKDLVL